MAHITPIEKWQLRRLEVLADMVEAILDAYRKVSPQKAAENCAELISRLSEFHAFSATVEKGETSSGNETVAQWMEILENIENDLISTIFSTFGDDSIEIIHDACLIEGQKWGRKALEEKGGISHDARKALLVLNDYLIDGMPTDDNIRILSSEAGQVTYINHHCNYRRRFGELQLLAWTLCSSRQAWKDGFFGELGGVAHQNITARCQGDDNCMFIITLTSE